MFTGTDKNLLLTTARYLDQKEYWLKKIFADPDGLPGTRLLSGNMKRSRNIPPPARYEKVAIPIPADLYTALMKLSRNTDLSLYLVLLATLESLIYHYTGSEDMLVISPLYKPNISAGTLNNFLFIRQEHTGHLTCKELLIATRQTVFEAYENQDYPFDHLLDLFFKSGQVPDAYLPGLCSHVECRLENIHAYENEEHTEIKDRLVFSFLHEEDRVSGHILYHSFIYDEFYVQQAAKHFVSILAVILANIDIKIMDISFLSEAEQEQLIHIFNKTETYYVDDKSLCERFAEQVSRRPGGTALVFEDCHVTYRLLDQDSDYLAFLLQKKGIINGDIVGLTGRRSLEMVVSIWGILKAGAAYLPIDPEYPKDRIDYMLKDSNAAILLTDIEKKTDNCQCSIVNCQLSMGESRASFYHSNLAYVIYTSGSTGKPKGVMVEQ
ncbi:MAG: AMP-binding protein, partial [Acidobacteria bacterium]|nr:AMP-binding protein [Acidobacteriota bacterium]